MTQLAKNIYAAVLTEIGLREQALTRGAQEMTQAQTNSRSSQHTQIRTQKMCVQMRKKRVIKNAKV
jgi:hypothetical protein